MFMGKSDNTSPNQNLIGDDSFLFDLLMEYVPYSIYFKDRESRFIKINRECAKQFGLSDPKEAIGKTDFDFLEHHHAQKTFKDEQQIIETGEPLIHILESGTRGPVEEKEWGTTSKFPMFNADGDIVGTFGITGDVTDQIHAEEALKKSEEKYRAIFENIQDVYYRTDTNGIVTEISPSIEKYSGYNRDEIIGSPVENFYYYQEDREDLIDKLKKTGRVRDHEIRLKTSDDKLVHTSITSHVLTNKQGYATGIEGIMRDISERKKVEKRLEESHETLRKLSEMVPGAIYQFQQYPDGRSRFPFASKGFEDLYEISPNDVKEDATEAVNRIHEEDKGRVIESISECYHTLEVWELEYRVDLPRKGVRWLHGAAKPEKLDDGSVIWHGYIDDVTDRKKKEEQLNDTLDIISDQNKRLLNFAHIVSHNLRNHASNITMVLSILEQENDAETEEEFFGHLKTASQRLNETIDDLNKIVDLQAKESEAVKASDVNEFLEKIREILSTEIISKRVKIKRSIPENFTLQYNPAYLESILLNLISNAIKYRHPDRDPVIEIEFYKNEREVVLKISDNGVGIDLARYGDKLFGMYKTFHKNKNSKGIGLYLTKNQIEKMGGSIEVESEVDKGTTFTVYFGEESVE